MSFTITNVPFDVKTGADLTPTQRAKFATDFELIQKSGTPVTGNLAVWENGKLKDGGAVPSGGDYVTKKAGAITGLIGVFDDTGDIIASTKKVSDFVTTTQAASYSKVYRSLTDIGVMAMDSTDWIANANAIAAALITRGGSLEIPLLSGGANDNLSSSIVYTGANGGKLAFSPSQGRFVAHLVSSTTNEVTFEVWRENNHAFCSSKQGTTGSGVNWKWSVVLNNGAAPSTASTVYQPKYVGILRAPNQTFDLFDLGGSDLIDQNGDAVTWGVTYNNNLYSIIITRNGTPINFEQYAYRVTVGSQYIFANNEYGVYSFVPCNQDSINTQLRLTKNGYFIDNKDCRVIFQYGEVIITIY